MVLCELIKAHEMSLELLEPLAATLQLIMGLDVMCCL